MPSGFDEDEEWDLEMARRGAENKTACERLGRGPRSPIDESQRPPQFNFDKE